MNGFIDIHSHILPQLDDGSKSMEQTLNMIRMANAEGIRTIIATPHFHEGRIMPLRQTMEERRMSVIEDADVQKSQIDFLTGGEIYYTHDSINQLNEKRIPTLANSRYALVEFSPVAEPLYIKKALQDFIMDGYLPIIAHVERYINISSDLDYIEDLIDIGAYVQINAMSVTGDMGHEYKKTTKKLLKNSLVHFIATDSHSDGQRAPRLQSCAKYIIKKYGEAYAKELMIDNPGRILCNEDI